MRWKLLCISFVILTYVKFTKESTTFEFLKSIRLTGKRITFAPYWERCVLSKDDTKILALPQMSKNRIWKRKSLNSSHILEISLSRITVKEKKNLFHCSKRNFRQGTNAFLALVLLVYKLYSIAAILFLLKGNSPYNSKLLHFYLWNRKNISHLHFFLLYKTF